MCKKIKIFCVPRSLRLTAIVAHAQSSPLRKKLCHFMIMVLSCFDLFTVTTNYPGVLLYLISWLMGDYDLLLTMGIYLKYSIVFCVFSVLALLVMSIERYLGAYHPIFHRTSITKRRLLTFLAILLIITTALYIISGKGTNVIRGSVFWQFSWHYLFHYLSL